ncbi:hypothetical protein J2S97_003708 [Arthrobacter oryzae]|nr:hypothetical protein [Arthrobacter oryzae]
MTHRFCWLMDSLALARDCDDIGCPKVASGVLDLLQSVDAVYGFYIPAHARLDSSLQLRRGIAKPSFGAGSSRRLRWQCPHRPATRQSGCWQPAASWRWCRVWSGHGVAVLCTGCCRRRRIDVDTTQGLRFEARLILGALRCRRCFWSAAFHVLRAPCRSPLRCGTNAILPFAGFESSLRNQLVSFVAPRPCWMKSVAAVVVSSLDGGGNSRLLSRP